MKQNSDLSKIVRDLVNDLKAQHDIEIGIIHCGNSSENKKLETDSNYNNYIKSDTSSWLVSLRLFTLGLLSLVHRMENKDLSLLRTHI